MNIHFSDNIFNEKIRMLQSYLKMNLQSKRIITKTTKKVNKFMEHENNGMFFRSFNLFNSGECDLLLPCHKHQFIRYFI